MPVLFELLSPPAHFPREIMTPIVDIMAKKAKAPFKEMKAIAKECTECLDDEDSLSFFPSLPRIRRRRYYSADVEAKDAHCTKLYRGHPSLMPGLFTLLCPHGMYENPVECFEDKLFMVTGICYGFQAMRFLESPNTPFTIIYERFPEGIQFTNVNAKGREDAGKFIHNQAFTQIYQYTCTF